jgi:tRNA-binding EMAP/Myf-like protein
MVTYNDFEKIDIRVGTITQVNDFPQARKPAYQILVLKLVSNAPLYKLLSITKKKT